MLELATQAIINNLPEYIIIAIIMAVLIVLLYREKTKGDVPKQLIEALSRSNPSALLERLKEFEDDIEAVQDKMTQNIQLLTTNEELQNKKLEDITSKLGSVLASMELFLEKTKCRYLNPKQTMNKLITSTLAASSYVFATRFSPVPVSSAVVYYNAFKSKVKGEPFDGRSVSPVLDYRRLMNINSKEKFKNLKQMVEDFKGCPDNMVINITSQNNHFEIVVIDDEEAFLCFHSLSPGKLIVMSSLHILDEGAVQKLRELYERMWQKDIFLEIDFSQIKTSEDVAKTHRIIDRKINVSG